MNLSMLTTFRVVLELGSFSAAAHRLGRSQSSISYQIKKIEAHMGQPLFDRSTRVVRPTELAHKLNTAIEDFLTQIDTLRVKPSMEIAGKIILGVITSIQSELLPSILKIIHTSYPHLDIHIATLNDSPEILVALKAGQIDVAIVVRPDNGGSSRLIWTDILRQNYVMYAPCDVSIEPPSTMLEKYGWVVFDLELSGGNSASRYVGDLVPNVKIQTRLRSIDAIISMVSSGLGVAVVPEPRKQLIDGYNVQKIDLGPKAPYRRIAIAWRKMDDGNRNIEAIFDAVKTAYKMKNRSLSHT